MSEVHFCQKASYGSQVETTFKYALAATLIPQRKTSLPNHLRTDSYRNYLNSQAVQVRMPAAHFTTCLILYTLSIIIIVYVYMRCVTNCIIHLLGTHSQLYPRLTRSMKGRVI